MFESEVKFFYLVMSENEKSQLRYYFTDSISISFHCVNNDSELYFTKLGPCQHFAFYAKLSFSVSLKKREREIK